MLPIIGTVDPRYHFRLWKCRSEEHTSELQSRLHLVCRLLLEKKNTPLQIVTTTAYIGHAAFLGRINPLPTFIIKLYFTSYLPLFNNYYISHWMPHHPEATLQ